MEKRFEIGIKLLSEFYFSVANETEFPFFSCVQCTFGRSVFVCDRVDGRGGGICRVDTMGGGGGGGGVTPKPEKFVI